MPRAIFAPTAHAINAATAIPNPGLLPMTAIVVPFDRLRMSDVDEVGGKNASLGEMIGELAGQGVRVPGGR